MVTHFDLDVSDPPPRTAINTDTGSCKERPADHRGILKQNERCESPKQMLYARGPLVSVSRGPLRACSYLIRTDYRHSSDVRLLEHVWP